MGGNCDRGERNAVPGQLSGDVELFELWVGGNCDRGERNAVPGQLSGTLNYWRTRHVLVFLQ